MTVPASRAGEGVQVTGEQPQVFGRGSNVLEYWLAHAEGFDVVSRRKPRHRVDHVIVDRQVGAASVLVVRRRRGRRTRVIPVSAIAAVDPFERLLYVTPKRRARTAAHGAYRAQQAAVTWAHPRLVETARLTHRGSVRAGTWLRPRIVAASRATTLAAARFAAAVVAGMRLVGPHIVRAGVETVSLSRRFAGAGAARLRGLRPHVVRGAELAGVASRRFASTGSMFAAAAVAGVRRVARACATRLRPFFKGAGGEKRAMNDG